MMLAARSQAACRHGVRMLRTSAPRRVIYNNISETIGRTPIVKINRMAPAGVTIYAKLEYFNPLHSVKDRLALGIIAEAEKSGRLKPGDTVVEATSGNTGISLAMICAQRGYRFVSCMVETFSIERRKTMRMLGAKVILTPAAMKTMGMVNKAQELAEKNGWFLAQQFESAANAPIHAQTTGPEILSDFAGQRLDYFVTGWGTGGTFTGAGGVIKKARPDVKVILSEPKDAPLTSSGIKQERKEVMGVYGAPVSGHPAFNPHPVQGWTPNFIPQVCQEGLDAGVHDEIVLIDNESSLKASRDLARLEGIFTGVSGGATVATALNVAAKAPEGSVILAMVPDTAERYLSTPLFGDIDAEMNEEELAILNSTPTCRQE